ncbi:MAG TPA: polysaccharide deacetylase family protein [Solirubrobacterales bacterium]|nr:polysaccharide deacetylase family protein [Solirubrobacterales bacterium]
MTHVCSEHGSGRGAAARSDPPFRLNIDSLPHAATRNPPIASPRKILCAAALAACALLLVPAGASARPQRIEHADLFQAGRDLVFTVRTAKPVGLAKLEARPDVRRPYARYLCLSLSADRPESLRLLCLDGREPHRRVGFVVLDENGKPLEKGSAPARVKRPSPDKLVVAVEPGEAGLSPGDYEWIVLQSNGCKVPRRCVHSFPVDNTKSIRLRPVRAVGCTGGGAGLATSGPRDRKVIALTFDDGPSDYTDDFLRVLAGKDVRATFFEIGQEMPGRDEAMRQILAQGSEIGDHTMNHVEFPDYAQIAGAASRITAYTHFRPCLFRPPGGGVDAGIVATAGSLGMRTVNWDVDPRDWSNPGSEAIYANVVGHVHPGAIVVMHDGGGARGETLTTLPRIIDTLRGRGYRFATVTELLGGRILYQPYH